MDATRVAERPQRVPLAEEAPLRELHSIDLRRFRRPQPGHRRRFPIPVRRVPVIPGDVVIEPFCCHKQRKIVQPVRFLHTKRVNFSTLRHGGPLRKGRRRAGQKRQLERLRRLITSPPFHELHTTERCLVEPALARQQLQRHQQRAAGKGGKALVRRLAVTRGSERQHLPQRLPGGGEKVDKGERGRAQIAGAVATRQGGGVEEDAALPCKSHTCQLRTLLAWREVRGALYSPRGIPMKTLLVGFVTAALLWMPALPAAEPDRIDYRVLATSKTSTMEKEMNEAGGAGYQFGDVMGGDSSVGGKEVIVVMRKAAGAPASDKRTFKLLATSKTSTMKKEMQQLGDEGYEYQGQTVFSSAFGGQEVIVIMQRNPAASSRTVQYRLLATTKTSTMQKELQEAGSAGFELVGMTISKTAIGGAEMVCILAKVSQ